MSPTASEAEYQDHIDYLKTVATSAEQEHASLARNGIFVVRQLRGLADEIGGVADDVVEKMHAPQPSGRREIGGKLAGLGEVRLKGFTMQELATIGDKVAKFVTMVIIVIYAVTTWQDRLRMRSAASMEHGGHDVANTVMEHVSAEVGP